MTHIRPWVFSGGEMKAVAGWDYFETDIHMRFDHWVSPDSSPGSWRHSSKIYESSGVFDGTDRRGSTWAPMAAFAGGRWHLFYVAYRGSPAYRTPLGLYRDNVTGAPLALHKYTQFDGEIWHSVSTVPGEAGIGGPYEDVGPVLDQEELGGFEPKKDLWEGDHGCDMFYPFAEKPDGTWLALYGSEMGRFPFGGPLRRQVGLAQFTPSTTPASTCRLVKQLSAAECKLGKTFGCRAENHSLWVTGGCRGSFQCGSQTLECDSQGPGSAPGCELDCGIAGASIADASIDKCVEKCSLPMLHRQPARR